MIIKTSQRIDDVMMKQIIPIKCEEKIIDKLHSYSVKGLVEVSIGYTTSNDFIYCIDEPSIEDSRITRNGNKKLSTNRNRYPQLEVVARVASSVIAEGLDGLPTRVEELEKFAEKYNIDLDFLRSNIEILGYYVWKGISGYGKIYPIILDPRVEEVAINTPERPVYVIHRDMDYGWIRTNIKLSRDELDNLVITLARKCGQEISIAKPYLEALLPEGHRVSATFMSEITRHGSSLIIRKHIEEPIPPTQLVTWNVVNATLLAYLWLMLEYNSTLLIVGPTASGKTTLLQALLLLLPPRSRIVTIEDTPELNLKHHENWDSLVTRYTYTKIEGLDIDLYNLSKLALRRRPDYFVIGEIRGEEARIFIQAAASGHGALATFHSDSVISALYRLKAPPINLGESFLQLIWAIIVIKRIRIANKYLRRVTEIVEVYPEEDGISLNTITKWIPQSDTHSLSSVEELIDKSRRLQQIANNYGIDREHLVKDLYHRKRFLEESAIYDYRSFIDLIKNFYTKRYEEWYLASSQD